MEASSIVFSVIFAGILDEVVVCAEVEEGEVVVCIEVEEFIFGDVVTVQDIFDSEVVCSVTSGDDTVGKVLVSET